jgi:hypothetical protein
MVAASRAPSTCEGVAIARSRSLRPRLHGSLAREGGFCARPQPVRMDRVAVRARSDVACEPRESDRAGEDGSLTGLHGDSPRSEASYEASQAVRAGAIAD